MLYTDGSREAARASCINTLHVIIHSLITAVGASVLWLTYASQADPSEISALVAKGSFRCV